MNVPLRRLAVVALVMVLALMGATTYYQFFRADALNNDPRNVRTIYREYGSFRGPIVVDGDAVALSTEVDDPFGFQRSYTDGKLYAAVTGYYSVVFGRTGIERTENDLLNGTADSLWLQRLAALFTGSQQQGSSVELTISAKAQEAAAKALGNQKGAVVAVEPKTGRVLALYSSPSFDPNVLAGHDTAQVNKAYQALLNDKDDPLVNRAIAGKTYPPGSTFKLVTAAAAIESGDYTESSVIDAPDRYTLPGTSTKLNNFGGERCSASGRQSLADALRISCNTAFAKLGHDLGADALRAQAEKFGFDQSLAIPLPVTPSRFPASPDAPQTALAAIGQGSVTETPMQVAMTTAAIANGGTVMQPYLVQTVRDPSLRVVSEGKPHELRQAISSGTAAQLTDMMVGVVKDGTGTAAQIPGVSVAGKSGTAETTKGVAPHAWFTAFAPVDDPKVAVAVIVEHGGNLGSEATGGAVAAPIARAVMQAVLG